MIDETPATTQPQTQPPAERPQFSVRIHAGKDHFEFGIKALNAESLSHMLDIVLTMSTGRIAGYELFTPEGEMIRSVFPFGLIGAIAPQINSASSKLIMPGVTMTKDLELMLKGRKRV